MGVSNRDNEFISKWWKCFKWYRKRKGGTWYLVRIPKNSVTDGFDFWSRQPPSPSKEYKEELVEKEVYKDKR